MKQFIPSSTARQTVTPKFCVAVLKNIARQICVATLYVTIEDRSLPDICNLALQYGYDENEPHVQVSRHPRWIARFFMNML